MDGEEKSIGDISLATIPVEYRSVSRFMALKGIFVEVLECSGLSLVDKSNLNLTKALVLDYTSNTLSTITASHFKGENVFFKRDIVKPKVEFDDSECKGVKLQVSD